MAMTLDAAIDRLRQLREVAGRGDLPVGMTIHVNGERYWEEVAFEIQNVLPTEFEGDNGENQWRCGEGMVNTKQIVSVF